MSKNLLRNLDPKNPPSRKEVLRNPLTQKILIEYDIDALRDGIEKAKDNIRTFEEAIEGENETMKEYRRIISVLEENHKQLNDGS